MSRRNDGAHLPQELLNTIVARAAYSSTRSAVALLRVARWTRGIASHALSSVLVVNTSPGSAELHWNDSAEDADRGGLALRLKDHLHRLEGSLPLSPAINFEATHSLCIRLNSNHQSSDRYRLGAILRLGCTGSDFPNVRRLADSLLLFQDPSLVRALPGLTHLMLIGKEYAATPSGAAFWMALCIVHATASPRRHQMIFPSTVVRLDLGHFPFDFLMALNSMDIPLPRYILCRFPKVTHLALTVCYCALRSAGPITVFIQGLLDYAALSHVVLVVRSQVCEECVASGVPVSEQHTAAEHLVSSLENERLAYLVRHGSEEEDWERLCRDDTDVWEVAASQRQTAAVA